MSVTKNSPYQTAAVSARSAMNSRATAAETLVLSLMAAVATISVTIGIWSLLAFAGVFAIHGQHSGMFYVAMINAFN